MSCCGNFTNTGPTRYKRLFDLGKWLAPSAALLLIPKCPLCIMAYVAAITGAGLSFSAAHNLRLILIAVSVIAIAYLVIRSLLARRWGMNRLPAGEPNKPSRHPLRCNSA